MPVQFLICPNHIAGKRVPTSLGDLSERLRLSGEVTLSNRVLHFHCASFGYVLQAIGQAV